MNHIIDNRDITELVCGTNFSYILKKTGMFSTTEYKVLQNQTNSCFVRCMKMLYNGQTELFYMTSSLKSFSSMIPSLDAEGFLTISANLIADIIDVKSNGFLSCQNIDLSFDHIFVDPTTYKVQLVYLPVTPKLFDSMSSFENELRTHLIKVIQSSVIATSSKIPQFTANLSNGSMSLETLYTSVKTGKISVDSMEKREPRDERITVPASDTGTMKIVAMNAPTRVEIVISKNEFVIGKKAELVDGVISFNKMISRSHCKIVKNTNGFSIVDLQSANGTYVNRIRLQPNQAHEIKNGDIIRLANSDFQVVIM